MFCETKLQVEGFLAPHKWSYLPRPTKNEKWCENGAQMERWQLPDVPAMFLVFRAVLARIVPIMFGMRAYGVTFIDRLSCVSLCVCHLRCGLPCVWYIGEDGCTTVVLC